MLRVTLAFAHLRDNQRALFFVVASLTTDNTCARNTGAYLVCSFGTMCYIAIEGSRSRSLVRNKHDIS